MSDQVLILSFLQGEKAAFNLLVYRWQKKIYHFALRYINDPHFAQEITQETFIRAFKNLNKLQDHDRFGTWLYQIAINLCKDRYAKKKRIFMSIQEIIESSGNGHLLPKEFITESPEEQLQQSELIQHVQKALAQLPEEQRIVVIMKQYQGLKFAEIAEILQEPVNTVKSRMYYGLLGIRKNLQSWHVA